MKDTMIVMKEIIQLNDAGKHALQSILEEVIDNDYDEVFYNDLTAAEKIIFLNIVSKQFEEAIKEEIEKILKKG